MAEEAAPTPEAAPAPATPAAARPPLTQRLGPIFQVVNTVALVALVAVQVLRPGGVRPRDAHAEERSVRDPAAEAHPAKAEGPQALPGPALRLADFVVHLRDVDAERYARISFELEMRDEKAKEALSARMPQLRDAFLVYLSDRTAEDLRGGEAIARIKGALSQKLGDFAPPGTVRALYMTELVVQ